MEFSIKNLFSKCDQIRCFLQIWSHLLKKVLIENFTSCAVYVIQSFWFTILHWFFLTLCYQIIVFQYCNVICRSLSNVAMVVRVSVFLSPSFRVPFVGVSVFRVLILVVSVFRISVLRVSVFNSLVLVVQIFRFPVLEVPVVEPWSLQ